MLRRCVLCNRTMRSYINGYTCKSTQYTIIRYTCTLPRHATPHRATQTNTEQSPTSRKWSSRKMSLGITSPLLSPCDARAAVVANSSPRPPPIPPRADLPQVCAWSLSVAASGASGGGALRGAASGAAWGERSGSLAGGGSASLGKPRQGLVRRCPLSRASLPATCLL